MFKVGITGGIGSGKTTVCKIFEVLGIPVFYADTVAKQLMVNDLILMEGVRSTFGAESYSDAGILNNKHLAGIVFNNPQELEKLNALVHPAVFRAFDRWIDAVPAATPYILKEAALLFESESYKMCDTSILVTAPKQVKLDRVTLRDGVTPEQVMARMDKQFTDEQKLLMAEHHVVNDESTSLIMQVLHLHRTFMNVKA
jgi:dephospho-CoA kinase